MANSLSEYEVTWNGENMNVAIAYTKIQNGEYPDTLVIDNPRYARLSFGRTMIPHQYVVQRLGAVLPGLGARRTWGNKTTTEDYLLDHINEVFRNLHTSVGALYTGRQKLTKLRAEGAKKMLNELEAASGKPMNQGVRNRVYEMLGQPLPVRGAYVVPANMARINTNLFREPEDLERINTSLFQGRRANRRSTRRTNRKNRKSRRTNRR